MAAKLLEEAELKKEIPKQQEQIVVEQPKPKLFE